MNTRDRINNQVGWPFNKKGGNGNNWLDRYDFLDEIKGQIGTDVMILVLNNLKHEVGGPIERIIESLESLKLRENRPLF